MIKKKKDPWYNWFTDNGIPLPLVRHHGRGDLVATAVVALLIVLMAVMLFGGTEFVLGKSTIKIPLVDSMTGAAAALIPFLGALFGYVAKRGQDRKLEGEKAIIAEVNGKPEG